MTQTQTNAQHGQPLLDIRGLHKRYDQLEVLKGVDLSMQRGNVVTLIGSSGSGKTTLLRCVNMLEEFQGGQILLDGEAVRQGAAGALLIHTLPSSSYPWSVPANGFSHERFHLAGAGNPIEGWLHEDTARELFAAGGFDLDALRAQAERRDFRPVDLTIAAKVELKSAIRMVEQYNVVGIVPGTDPKLNAQAVVYSAHWDHMGIDDEAQAGTGAPDRKDRIYNGAIDNASGTAALLAMAAEAVKKPARRTQVFMWPAAEEQGLLGSAAYV